MTCKLQARRMQSASPTWTTFEASEARFQSGVALRLYGFMPLQTVNCPLNLARNVPYFTTYRLSRSGVDVTQKLRQLFLEHVQIQTAQSRVVG